MVTGIEAPAPSDVQLDEAIRLMRGSRVAVLTGAGVSTDSGIPDYRGEGAPVRAPMTFQTFLTSETARKRYWAGSHLGWRHFGVAEPNDGHRALAALESGGVVSGVVTQNVDGLHRRAGSTHVVELHGATDRVLCLSCGQVFARQSIADRLEQLNPHIDLEVAIRPNPDGDVDVDDPDAIVIPECTVCGGLLKPDVVFFGESVPKPLVERCFQLTEESRALLVLGSSLKVMSGYRFVRRAAAQGIPVGIITHGPTRGDAEATHQLDAPLGTTLSELVSRLAA